MKTFHKTSLTERQWEVIRFRASGLTQAEIAQKLRTTRENVSEIEHRARLKINAAKATLDALHELNPTSEVLVPTGTSVFEAVTMIITRADILGTRLQGTADDILSLIRLAWRAKIKGHRLASVAKVEILADGSLKVKKE